MNTYQHVPMDAQLTALGDATRRAILERLLNGPVAVGELAREFPISRPAGALFSANARASARKP